MDIIKMPDPQIKHAFLKYWSEARGFGFLRTEEHGVWRDIFFHASAIKFGDPVIGCAALFTDGLAKKGKCAVNVRFSPAPEPAMSDAAAEVLKHKELEEMLSGGK